jgi:hypothetical protein
MTVGSFIDFLCDYPEEWVVTATQRKDGPLLEPPSVEAAQMGDGFKAESDAEVAIVVISPETAEILFGDAEIE